MARRCAGDASGCLRRRYFCQDEGGGSAGHGADFAAGRGRCRQGVLTVGRGRQPGRCLCSAFSGCLRRRYFCQDEGGGSAGHGADFAAGRGRCGQGVLTVGCGRQPGRCLCGAFSECLPQRCFCPYEAAGGCGPGGMCAMWRAGCATWRAGRVVARSGRLAVRGRRAPRAQSGSVSSQTPPCGRSVRIITGSGSRPLTGVKPKLAMSVARMMTASCSAKLAPMQIRGPSPTGR